MSNVLRSVARWYSLPVVLAAWELMARSGMISHRLMPDLWTIASAFWAALIQGDVIYHASFSVWRGLVGFGLAAIAGVALGAAMARSRWFEAIFEPVFSFGYPIPKIALFPIFIFIFGLGHMSKIALVFLESLYPITVGTYYGIKSVERIYIWNAQAMGAKPRQIFFRVLIPASLPYIASGLRIAVHVALIVVIILEMIGDSTGLGYFVVYAGASYEYARSFAGILAIVIVGFTIDRVAVALRNRLVFWQREIALR